MWIKLSFHDRYLQARRKGLMSEEDLRKRLNFANRVRRLGLGAAFWTEGVSLYLDACGFAHKTNPCDQARTPKARLWRKRNEGLTRGCTTKGAKEGVHQLRFIVAMSYQRGIVLCKVIYYSHIYYKIVTDKS